MIFAALDAYARHHARVFDDRANTIGGSDVGQCARKVFYLKNEGTEFSTPRNPDFSESWGATLRGSTYETHVWTPALRERYGDRLKFAGDQQETFVLGYLSATPDGLITGLAPDALASLGVPDIGGDNSLVTEAKTVDPRARVDGPRLEHVFQAQVQLGLLHALTEHRPDYALISYTDASFWDLVYEFPIRRDPTVFETASKRAAKILTATSADELQPEGWIAGGRECEFCPFSHACGGERARVPPQATEEPDPQFVSEIAEMARGVKQHEAALEAATAVLRTSQVDLKNRLRGRGFRRVVGDGIAVTWSAVKGRPSYDMKAIREAATAAGIDITEFETVGEPSDRLVIQTARQSRHAA